MTTQNINVGLIGCGVIGGVMKQWLEVHNPSCKIFVSDPPKNLNDDLSDVDIIFINIHILTKDDGIQDFSTLKSIIKSLPKKPIFIRTTLLPGTCEQLSTEFKRKIYFMPEFLTERTAYQDFCDQPMIFTGEFDLLERIFIGKQNIQMTPKEAEITKYAHNVFGALKVTYFNGIHELAMKNDCNYENIRQGILLSQYINPMHTMVPGPDGKLGYGGKCFPKDVEAFIAYTKGLSSYDLLKEISITNSKYRKLND